MTNTKQAQRSQTKYWLRSFGAALMASTAFALANPAYAQDTDGAEGETAQEEEDVGILVTATRRSESLQTVGLSITAVTGEELAERGVNDFEDFAISVPNLAFGATDDGVLANRTITIRGIEGLNTTGFYIDDVPLDESVSPLVLDVERVEVLRGPQGTLYGARGLGGTVRLITKQPEFDEVSGRARARLSSVDEGGVNYAFNAAINLPLNDVLAVRLAGYFDEQSGIFDLNVGPASSPGIPGNAGDPGVLVGDAPITRSNVDDRTIYGGQAAIRFQPDDRLNIVARVLGQRTELDGFPLADNAFDPANPPANFNLSADNFTQNRLFDIPEFGIDEWYQASLSINYETDFGTFTSSTGYFDRTTEEGEDTSEFISFTLFGVILPGAGLPTVPTALPSPIFQELNFSTFAQEFRFVSEFDGPFQFTAGAFYQDTDDNEAFSPPNFATGLDAAFSQQVAGIPSGALGGSDLIFLSDTTFTVEEIGIYGEASLEIFDGFTITAGARYFDVETEFTDFQDGFAAGGPNAVGPLPAGESGVNLKFLAEYEASDDIYLYASASEGFRIGGANGDLPTALGCDVDALALGINPDDTITFNSDSLWSYEAGIKTSFAGGTINAAFFHVDFSDIQQRVLLGCGFDFVANIGAARSQGVEIESAFDIGDGFEFGVNFGYTDAKFTETVPGLVNDGDRLQQVPKITLSANVAYKFVLNDNWDGFVRSDIAFVDDSISRVVDSSNPRTRPSYAQAGLRIGATNDDFTITVFADNLFNEDAVFADNRTLAAEAFGRPRIVRNRPRTIGVELQTNF